MELQEHSTISYHALMSGISSSTFRFTAQMNGTLVQVLVDRGSTHKFLQPRASKYLQLPIEPVPKFSVMVGNGQCLPCEAVSRHVSLLIQGSTLVDDLYVLPFYGSDIVLGVAWLATLGPVLTNYASRVFEFTLNGSKVSWQGKCPTDAQPIQLHSLRRMDATNAITSFFCLEVITEDKVPTVETSTDLAAPLESYGDVF